MTPAARLGLTLAQLLLPIIGLGQSLAQEGNGITVPPPPTIADITAILDREKPDPEMIAQLHANADADAPSGADRARLAKFHYDRCQARFLLGELRGAIADCERAVQLGEGVFGPREFARFLQGLSVQYLYVGDSRKSLDVLLRLRSQSNVKGSKGFQFNAYANIVDRYINLGDIDQAEATVRRSAALIQEARGWPNYSNAYLHSEWEADFERAKGRLYVARGQYREAEAILHRAEVLKTAALRNLRVSYWPVNSAAAVKLTTHAFAELKAHPDTGRAEALRRSMVELIQHGSIEYAHPAIWAPFVLVGEGRPTPPTAPPASPILTHARKERVTTPDWRTKVWSR